MLLMDGDAVCTDGSLIVNFGAQLDMVGIRIYLSRYLLSSLEVVMVVIMVIHLIPEFLDNLRLSCHR